MSAAIGWVLITLSGVGIVVFIAAAVVRVRIDARGGL